MISLKSFPNENNVRKSNVCYTKIPDGGIL
jgi:hypothetical protein